MSKILFNKKSNDYNRVIADLLNRDFHYSGEIVDLLDMINDSSKDLLIDLDNKSFKEVRDYENIIECKLDNNIIKCDSYDAFRALVNNIIPTKKLSRLMFVSQSKDDYDKVVYDLNKRHFDNTYNYNCSIYYSNDTFTYIILINTENQTYGTLISNSHNNQFDDQINDWLTCITDKCYTYDEYLQLMTPNTDKYSTTVDTTFELTFNSEMKAGRILELYKDDQRYFGFILSSGTVVYTDNKGNIKGYLNKVTANMDNFIVTKILIPTATYYKLNDYDKMSVAWQRPVKKTVKKSITDIEKELGLEPGTLEIS